MCGAGSEELRTQRQGPGRGGSNTAALFQRCTHVDMADSDYFSVGPKSPRVRCSPTHSLIQFFINSLMYSLIHQLEKIVFARSLKEKYCMWSEGIL